MRTSAVFMCVFYIFSNIDNHYAVRSIPGKRFNISALFDYTADDDLKKEFKYAIDSKGPSSNMHPVIKTIDVTDSFAVSNAICENLENGVAAIIGVSKTCALSTIQSYSNTFQVPFLTLSMPQKSTSHAPFQLYMRPQYIEALVEVIIMYRWKRLFYVYDTDEGLIRVQHLFQAYNAKESYLLDIIMKRVADAWEAKRELEMIYNDDMYEEEIRVLLDINHRQSQLLLNSVRDASEINNARFHFLLGDLGIEDLESSTKLSGLNITGFTLTNYTDSTSFKPYLDARKLYEGVKGEITLDKALIIDAISLIHKALKKMSKDHETLGVSADKNCRLGEAKVKFKPGMKFMSRLKSTSIIGFTGHVRFDEKGFRKGYKLHLLEATMKTSAQKVGHYEKENGLTMNPSIVSRRVNTTKPNQDIARFQRMITTVMENSLKHHIPEITIAWQYEAYVDAPYVMRVDPHNPKDCGKENFMGFCIDLAEEIANYVNFTYDICLVKDGKYGEKLKNGSWNGMIGELYRGDAHLAVAPITISSERERVVDFTKPFMSLGISIMIKRPSNAKAHVFSFMDPLSYEIWMCILFAYVGVSVVLFLVSRFSPSEWHMEEDSNITNDFTISNSLWYSLGAFMQQGCDISPKAISGRIVGSVWWFFTLIIISSYTANLAAFLTVERMNTPIESAEDLAKQTNIRYGVLDSGTTKTFFKDSQVAIYERMWAYMTSANPNVFVSTNDEGVNRVRESNGRYAFLVESTMNEYINMRKPCDTMKVGANLDSKGYGIATPVNSDLRDYLTLAVLHLRESGVLRRLKRKWWDNRSECPDAGVHSDGQQAALSLNNVAGIFYILISGLTLAIFIAGIEFLYKSVVDSRRSKASFGSVIRCKARLSFRGSIDKDSSDPAAVPIRKTLSTYTYKGPTQLPGFDPYVDTNNTHTQV